MGSLLRLYVRVRGSSHIPYGGSPPQNVLGLVSPSLLLPCLCGYESGGYCQTQEVVSGIPLTVEHITPKAKGGSDDNANLWLSCRLCNEKKGTLIEAMNPETGDLVSLFNPRTQTWADHFTWSEDG